MMYGATYEFYNQDHRKGIQEVVEQKVEKKKKEQGSGEGSEDQRNGPGQIFNKMCKMAAGGQPFVLSLVLSTLPLFNNRV